MEGAQARLFGTPYLAQGASGDGRELRPDLCRTDDPPGRWRWRGAARVARPDPGRHADRRRRRRCRVRYPAMPRGDCGARCNTVDPATRGCDAVVEANARRGLVQRRDRCHRPKQPAGLEEGGGCHRRSLAKTLMYRLKVLTGRNLAARTIGAQATEVAIRVGMLNRMTSLARPQSVRIA